MEFAFISAHKYCRAQQVNSLAGLCVGVLIVVSANVRDSLTKTGHTSRSPVIVVFVVIHSATTRASRHNSGALTSQKRSSLAMALVPF